MIPIHPLIRHLVTEHLEQITAQSYLHCHAMGLHSIMLINQPGYTVRLFCADVQHTLCKNTPAGMAMDRMSLGFHAHHCNLTLHVISGRIYNWIVAPVRKGFLVNAYVWNSPITGGTGEFSLYQENVNMQTIAYSQLDESQPIARMEAADIHTIAIEQGQPAAWLIYEGREDPGYEPITFSNGDLSGIDMTGMYQRPTEDQVMTILSSAGLLLL